MRVVGNVIWCTRFQAVTTEQKTASALGKDFGTATKVTSFELFFVPPPCRPGQPSVTDPYS